ncbi:BTAD domain-containing putative transcriptional regulator [Streptomyces sp. B1866]|uniref:AfsR/SARP family transcriptional regulator n=1 Tax=Streptomyces sp. B1866 TaxID=3075431 RepID=UPI00288E71FF|nr:BTAD domain-containing putative transcriptional regulator [Streptomyces sp. B1866]MDT3400460.1 BTAD domain-containing putative transcriptional regulator [Streptomyces sp. B1866]
MEEAEFRLLGPVGIWHEGSRLGPTAAQQRSVLAALLLEPGRVVSVGRLVMAVWEEDPPGTARNALQVHISRLRRLLAPLPGTGLTTTAQGYCLAVERGRVDLYRFRDLVARARQSDGDAAAALLRQALQLWHGPALADVAGGWLGRAAGAGLEEERRAAVEECAALDLRAGRHHEAVSALSGLVADHPLRERAVGLLMEALHGCGRRADALALFRGTRQRYVEELGLEPGDALQELHLRILDTGTGPGPAPRRADDAPRPGAVPQQLPSDVTHFVGREGELAWLDALLAPPDPGPRARPGPPEPAGPPPEPPLEPTPRHPRPPEPAVPARSPSPSARPAGPTAAAIAVIGGSGGVGKTTLAVHWAHRVRDRFPDGQLYVNLRGFGPTGAAMAPAEALRGFLDAFQVPAQRVPAAVEDRTALYRSLLAGRRVLVVLDNARDTDQVRPLLPGSPGCLALVTSRSGLTGLVAAEQAQPLSLDLLAPCAARELLARRLGGERAEAEPRAVADMVAACAGLPLALAVVAARAAAHPGFSLAALARELRDARGSLDAFDSGDAATDVRAVFSWSYHALDDAAARLFRLLSLHPGPEVGALAAASLAGLPATRTRALLCRLTRAHLLTERTPGQYTLHDLLRAYATELSHGHDSEAARRAALHRVLDHVTHTALAAGRAFTPHRDPIPLDPPRPGVATEVFSSHGQALTWFTVEHPALLALLQRAADSGFETHAWQLAWCLAEFLDQVGHWQDQATVHRTALDAARRTGDVTGQAHSHHGLGLAHLRMGHYALARTHLTRALDLHAETGDAAGQALTHVALNLASERQGRHEEGLHHAQRALVLYRAAGHRRGEAYALNNVGWAHAMLGDHQEALVHCEKALMLSQERGDGRGASAAWDSLGYAHHHLGHHDQAIACYLSAVELRRSRGERVREAESLSRLGATYLAAGDPAQARSVWRATLRIFNELGHPDAAGVRERLARLDGAYGAAVGG